MKDMITRAIEEMRSAKFTYRGESYMVFPHIYGFSENNGEILRAWLSDTSDGTNYQGWRDFEVSDIVGFTIVGTFDEIRNHPNLREHLKEVYAVVDDSGA